MNTRRLWPLIFTVTLAVGSCGGDDSATPETNVNNGGGNSNNTGGGTSSNGDSDAGGGLEDASDDATGMDGSGGDDGGLTDTDEPLEDVDTGPPPTQEAGDLCADDNDCISGFCLFVGNNIEQGFCSDFCSDADDCPEPAAYACVPFANSGSDL
ncbi:MAG: hypothetical protein AAFX99_27535, partial [Myxococcota bacterium]